MTINRPDKKAGNGDDPVVIKRKPGSSKDVGGGETEIWNRRQTTLLVSALPGVNAGEEECGRSWDGRGVGSDRPKAARPDRGNALVADHGGT